MLEKQPIPTATIGDKQTSFEVIVIFVRIWVENCIIFGDRQYHSFRAEFVELALINRNCIGLEFSQCG